MKNLVVAKYTPIERGSFDDTENLVQRLLKSEIPAFVIANSGVSLKNALKETAVDKILKANGFDGNVKNSVEFVFKTSQVLPDDLKDEDYLIGDEWAQFGVTSMHTDQHSSEQGRQFSLNHTRAGSSEVRLHPARLTHDQLDEQWDLFDEQTGDLLWHDLVNPDLIAPEGHKARIIVGDLLVFDPSNAHVVRSLETPRISEATFFNKV